MQKSVKRFYKIKNTAHIGKADQLKYAEFNRCEVLVGVVPLISQGQESEQLQVAFVRSQAT